MAAPKSHRSKSRGGPGVSKDSKKSFKGKRKPNEAAQQKSLALHLEDDDVPDFPRGGGSLLSRQEREEIRAEVDERFAADKRMEKKKRRKDLQTRGRSNDDDLGLLFGDGISGKLPKFVNRITFKNVSAGMKVWGLITEVNEKDLVVSLPGNLRGLVRLRDAYDPELDVIEEGDGGLLSNMFHVGEFVSCVVLRVDDDSKEKGKRKIWLSLRLSLLHKGFTMEAIQEGMVLSARVKSVEDHGYILHFGLLSFSGFLPKDSQDGSRIPELKSGKLLQGIVKGIDKTRRVVYLNHNLELVSKHVTKDLKGISIDLLVPGMMVNALVKSTLANGVLLSFLTYFTGTVDMFHLEDNLPTRSWSEDYPQNKKVNARILFIDPSSRAVGLTLNPCLLRNKAPTIHVKVGEIYEDAKVVRVDKGFGLLLEIPSIPESTPAYVGLSDIAEANDQKLEKKFKEGSHVRVRVLGFRHLEGLAVGILKAAAFEGSVFTHSDVKPGMVVKAKIIAVDSFGAIVQFSGGVKALCPLQHMSEFETTKPRKKFKVGAELVFRVLGCKSKRITVTHKKTMVKSKLTILSSYADATDGLITHGWITKIEKSGCFVRFYNGVQGFAPRSELGLQAGSDPVSMYHVGQVVKCRVTSAIPAVRRINLSFMMKPARLSEDDEVKIGGIVSGTVEGMTPRGISVYLDASGYSKGIIPVEHLSDHHEHAVLLSSVLKPDYKFDRLLVLDIEGNNLLLSAKNSLISSVYTIPLDLSHVHTNSLVHGYVCNLIETGCFVRFLGRLTGFCPKKKATDDQRSDLSEAFFIGQSVRTNILNVDNENGRITLSLKQSCCPSADASFIEEYFLLDEKIAMLQFPNCSGYELKCFEEFKIGGIIEGKIQERKEYGVVVSFGQYNDILGFITHNQCGRILNIGDDVEAAVLDVAKAERLIDLSLKPEFVDDLKRERLNSHSQKKKRKRESLKNLELHQTVTAVVEIVKENYLVLSLLEYNHAVGYALVYDYNTQKFPQKNFVNGQSVTATVVSLPSGSSTGRLLLLLKTVGEVNEKSSSKRAKKKSSTNIGSLVQAEVTEIKPLEMRLKFGIGFRGRVYIADVNDDVVEDPLRNYKVGQTVTARIIERSHISDTKRNNLWELSLKQCILAESYEIEEKSKSEDFEFSVGQRVCGYVYKVSSEWAWIAISRHVRAQLFVLDSGCDPAELRDFPTEFSVGKTASGYVLTTNNEKKLLRIVRCPLTTSDCHKDKADGPSKHEDVTAHMHEGSILGGRISKILPGVGGLMVQLGPAVYGRVNFTEINDLWVPDPLSGYQEGQFVRCKVLEISRSGRGTVHIDLSLRSSLDGMHGLRSKDLPQDGFIISKNFEIGEIQAGMDVQGYVKNITSKGCFIMLSRKFDAKICLSNLSDGYVDDPEKEFPVGKLVKGKILTVDPQSKRIEVTLRSSNATKDRKPGIKDFSSLHIGDIVSGYIKRVEPYGLFITIDHTNLVGLCHRSELSDEPLDNIELKYRAGEKVTAKILKVDEERQRIALGMKSSYFLRGNGVKEPLEQVAEHPTRENGNNGETMIISSAGGVLGIDNMIIEDENNDCVFLAQAESRASVPPLEVTLDEIEHFDDDIAVTPKQDLSGKLEMTDEKSKKRAKKKAKEEREREIRAAEERLLEKDIPQSPDEFEKLVRSSPNSSFIWIKYMAFMLSLADIDKARSIAERALKTINIREENEKLNIWVAYFNLENEYGNPPEEAVMQVFQRALQYCDPKKVHLALLGMYERTEQHKLADELLDKMVKKYKHSSKVWLRRVQRLLKNQQDGVQSVVQRALLCLPCHKHIKFISQTAILEFKCGVPDRGRSMFEGILREYPKRTDLWNIYLDQEIRLGDAEITRSLFERAISLSLPLKKIKFLFKKYLAYEKTGGDEARIEYVKQKAMDYAESTRE